MIKRTVGKMEIKGQDGITGKCVIVGAAEIGNYEKIKEYFAEDDFYIFCDGGLKHTECLGVEPDLIVGDFDSFPRSEAVKTAAELITLPCEKDDTDTVFAVKEALARGFTDFLLVGVVGQRLDHTLGNLSVLLMLDKAGAAGKIIDDYSEMLLVSDSTAYVDDSFSYFSVLSVGGEAGGISEKNAKYTLENASISSEYQYGISNEVLPGKTSEISVKSGRLLLIKVF